MSNPREIEAADDLASRLAHRAIAMGGTCTGEHGIGQKKIAYMEDEHGPGRSTSCAGSRRRSIRRTCSIPGRFLPFDGALRFW